MKIKHLLATAFAVGSVIATAQTGVSIPEKNEAAALEKSFQNKYENRLIELRAVLKNNNLPEIEYGKNGIVKQAMYVTPTGHVVYNTSYNIGAGKTLSTNKVWPGGTANVSLTGENMPNLLGVWDEAKVLSTHQEFGGRVTLSDASSTFSDHATHVAGTMIASGVEANAKGMSYKATVKSYDWNNDATEMIQAANAGMLISNHSYGTISGWYYSQSETKWYWYGDRTISNVEDYKFGLYDERAQEWDEIAMNYPNYLICKAAGNDRGDNKSGNTWYYADGTQGSGVAPLADGGATGFDCISTYGTAKNILTIGAVSKIGGNTGNGWTKASDVIMSSFSGFGPTDDGRIKPDLVAPGVSIYSCVSTGNTAYESLQGTSMATPAASGSLLLVQQHYNNLKKKFMRSATLKGLAIHTADEAGAAEGPDYRNGWGLMNTASCVKFITDSNTNKLEERTITGGQIQNIQFNADAGSPLRVTICWTDRPGTPVASNLLDNTAKMLVNDLDIRLTRKSDNQVFSPYILNPANPAAAATKGDNFRDNVEMIHIAAPQAGIYTLQITHKGVLASAQAYSLFISNGVEKSAALFTSNRAIICPGQQITYTDGSTGGVTSRVWYFPGGTPSTSTTPNQVVTYPNAGRYPVALKIISAIGTDSVYKENYVTVGGLDLPFTENFEVTSPTVGSWTFGTLALNPDGNLGETWGLKAVGGTSPGDRAFGIEFNKYSSISQRDGLLSPALSLQSTTNNTLTFKHAYTRFGSTEPSDSLVIYVSTDCGNSFSRIASLGEDGTGTLGTYGASKQYSSDIPFFPSVAADWCGSPSSPACKTISLAAYDGAPSIIIKFEGYNAFGNNLFIDNIEVKGTPLKPVADFVASKTTACVGEPITLSDRSMHKPAAWLWSTTGANVPTSTLQNPVITYAAAGTYSVKLKSSNVSGSDSVEKTAYITVVAKPAAPNLKYTSLLACIGDSVLLSTDSSNVKWYAGNNLIADNVKEIYVKSSDTIRAALSNGICETSVMANVLISVKPATPVVTPSVTGSMLCPDATSVLTSSALTGNQWYRNMQAIQGATTRTYNATDSGSYTVIAKPGGCASDPSAAISYALNQRPSVGVISGEENPRRDETVTFSVPDQAGHTFQWSITNGNISQGGGTATISAKFTKIDSAVVSVVSKQTSTGCTSIASVKRLMVAPAVGLPEYKMMSSFIVYPVPSHSVVNVEFESIKAHTSTLKVVNILGQVIAQRSIDLRAGKQTEMFNVSSFDKGIYFIELSSNDNKVVRKIIVE